MELLKRFHRVLHITNTYALKIFHNLYKACSIRVCTKRTRRPLILIILFNYTNEKMPTTKKLYQDDVQNQKSLF